MNNEASSESIARLMASSSAEQLNTQISQTRFRQGLVAGWKIPLDATVLEIGCGQGDMTAVLASVVGGKGHVTAVDIAGPDYGAPVTVGQAAAHLKSSYLGPRIDFHFGYDVLDSANHFPPDTFDYVVLAHCSWYFASRDSLKQTLLRVRPWAKRLCFSEWNMEPRSLDQVAHLLAVLVQGQIHACGVSSDSNVQTPLSKQVLLQLLEETGWGVALEEEIDASSLQDARWEIENCLRLGASEAASYQVQPKLDSLLRSQVDVLHALAAHRPVLPLPSYAILAEHLSATPPNLG